VPVSVDVLVSVEVPVEVFVEVPVSVDVLVSVEVPVEVFVEVPVSVDVLVSVEVPFELDDVEALWLPDEDLLEPALPEGTVLVLLTFCGM
jgi:hypothetical protein